MIAYMSKVLERAYLRALALVSMRDVSRGTGRGYSTLQAYRAGERRVTSDAARELVGYLRSQAETFTEAARRLEAALAKEEEQDG